MRSEALNRTSTSWVDINWGKKNYAASDWVIIFFKESCIDLCDAINFTLVVDFVAFIEH